MKHKHKWEQSDFRRDLHYCRCGKHKQRSGTIGKFTEVFLPDGMELRIVKPWRRLDAKIIL